MAKHIYGYLTPTYSDEAREDALFHYTTGVGLSGIIQNRELWATAYYCTNDDSELSMGRGFLTPYFVSHTKQLIDTNDATIQKIRANGVNPYIHANSFEQFVVENALAAFPAFICCFCKANSKEDFSHGLLSQWRGYGIDGGYALQFSKKKILAAIEAIKEPDKGQYEIRDIAYDVNNRLRQDVLNHIGSFKSAYEGHLAELAEPFSRDNRNEVRDPIVTVLGGPVESLVNYLIHTKSEHFAEERECRLSYVEIGELGTSRIPTKFIDRNGLLVPYKALPNTILPFLDCLESIIVGPNQRMSARFHAVCELIKEAGLKVSVRPSKIPFIKN